MGSIYRVTHPDGSVTYSDRRPPGDGQVDVRNPNTGEWRNREDKPYDHGDVRRMVREAQKRIPALPDYIEYLSYLRSRRPLAFDRALADLRRQDPASWMALQRHPQFRPLRESMVGLRAAEKHIAAGVGMAGGNTTGSLEKWLETSLKDLMKRDRWGPFADGGASSSTLQKSRAAVRGAATTAISRPLGVFTNVGMEFLNPEVGNSAAQIALALRMRKLYERGMIDEIQFSELQGLLSSGQYAEMKRQMDDYARAGLGQGR